VVGFSARLEGTVRRDDSMQNAFKKPEGRFGEKDTNGAFRYNPDANRQERKWIKYADGVYEPVRADGDLRKKKDDYRSFKWWGVDKPADWKPEHEGAGFSWNHTLGSKADLADQKTGEPFGGDSKKTAAPPPLADRVSQGFDRAAGSRSKSRSLLAGGSASLEPDRRDENASGEAGPSGGSTGTEAASGMVQSKGQGRSGKASGNDPYLEGFKEEYEKADQEGKGRDDQTG